MPSFRNFGTAIRVSHDLIPNLHHIQFTESIFQESTSLLQKGICSNMTLLFQKSDTFDRTAKGSTWLASQDHPDYTQSIWSSSIKMHIMDSQELNYLKNIAIDFGRNSHLLVSNPLLTKQRHLDQF